MIALVTNDDGPGSPGLEALIEEALKAGFKLYLAIPSGQRSGSGKAVKFRVSYEERELWGVKTFIVDGTPADAVSAALDVLIDRVDIVLCGVNIGPNLGIWDILSSGTLGAAFEAAIRGIPAVASSLVARHWEEFKSFNKDNYVIPARLAIEVAKAFLREKLAEDIDIVNINVPSWEIKGIKATFIERKPIHRIYVKTAGNVLEAGSWFLEDYVCSTPGSDICEVIKGYISVTPIKLESMLDSRFLSRVSEIISHLNI